MQQFQARERPRDEREEDDAFGKRCGPCHRALTTTRGGLGRGSVAPNLSGLFTRYYPKTAPGGAAWEERSLKKWIALAINSLPVPVSPRSRTVVGASRTIETSLKTSSIRGPCPTI